VIVSNLLSQSADMLTPESTNGREFGIQKLTGKHTARLLFFCTIMTVLSCSIFRIHPIFSSAPFSSSPPFRSRH